MGFLIDTSKALLGMNSLRRAASVGVLAFLDAASLYFGLSLAARLFPDADSLSFIAPVLLAVWVCVFAAFRLYDRAPVRRSPGSLAGAAMAWAGLSVAGTFFYPGSGLAPGWVALSALLGLVLAASLRLFFEGCVERIYRRGLGQLPVVIVGGEEGRSRIRLAMERVPGAYSPVAEVGFVEKGSGERVDIAALREALDATGAGGIILADAERLPDEEFLALLESARLRGVPLRVVPGAASLLGGRPRLHGSVGLPLLEVRYPRLDNTQRALKRTMDVAVSLPGLILLSPLFLTIALTVRGTSPGPALLRQKRAGADEKVFICYKFRSMREDAGDEQAGLEEKNEAEGAVFKIRGDPRITSFGWFLRRWSLDELPQLLNVLKGEMSLVGPRPLPMRDFERLGEDHKRRLAAPPGMTGHWQVRGRSDLPFEEMVRLDLHYIENWSLSFDMKIIAKTLGAVLRGEGAH
ncbi:MAG: sugar transferase [Actinomycetota bacterium]|jgi:exopolysaccharide biosynthesis polyprenyl glycosylphosphotransferase|nr:sugar transferase [Actinomycetota bacterium]